MSGRRPSVRATAPVGKYMSATLAAIPRPKGGSRGSFNTRRDTVRPSCPTTVPIAPCSGHSPDSSPFAAPGFSLGSSEATTTALLPRGASSVGPSAPHSRNLGSGEGSVQMASWRGRSARLSPLAAANTLERAPVLGSRFMPWRGATVKRAKTGPMSTPPCPGTPRPLRYSSRRSDAWNFQCLPSSSLRAVISKRTPSTSTGDLLFPRVPFPRVPPPPDRPCKYLPSGPDLATPELAADLLAWVGPPPLGPEGSPEGPVCGARTYSCLASETDTTRASCIIGQFTNTDRPMVLAARWAVGGSVPGSMGGSTRVKVE
mmetsp:Transcript_39060/g.87349  ORF Transcript_39060/g.87349 Transcript_39060/m.87349 type:complete len:316 (-) Transcript_39060:2260-3207(-)